MTVANDGFALVVRKGVKHVTRFTLVSGPGMPLHLNRRCQRGRAKGARLAKPLHYPVRTYIQEDIRVDSLAKPGIFGSTYPGFEMNATRP